MDIFDLEEPSSSEVVSSRTPIDPPFLADLNPEQKQAVTTTEGPLLVLSGAGTGKTRVLTTRIAYILATGLAQPWQILAVTFTNKASKEMKARVEQMVGAASAAVWLGTFHAIGIRVLRKHGGLVNLNPTFIVLNSDDQERLMKQIMVECSVDIKKYPPGVMLEIIQRWKDRGLMPEAVTEAQNSYFCDGRALDFYRLYQLRLQEMNAVDFGDLLALPLELFKKNPDVLALYQQQFHYILVDEYQDTNVAQYMLLRLLAKGHNNICCVGDDDQSIYSWRGAEVENILKFTEIFPGATVVRLERNYRSTRHILGAASALIANNAGRLGKTLRAAKDENDLVERVGIQGFWNGAQEAEKIIEQVEDGHRCGTPLSQMAILVRASFQTREFEEALIRQGISYKIIGGFKFYEREEIRDAVAYLRLILNPNDDLAFMRAVNKPRRGIGDGAIGSVRDAARTHRLSLFDAIPWADLRPAVKKSLESFSTLIHSWRDLVGRMPSNELAKRVLEESGYVAMWRQDKSIEAEGRLENIQELYNVLGDFDTIETFIEYASLVTDADETVTTDQLTVMTLHASKGLEFDHIYLPGWEEGLFPHQKAMDEGGESGLEEERRLAYVGLTRARKLARVSYAANRRVYGQWQNAVPSRFIEELPDEHVENKTEGRMGSVSMDEASAFRWQRPSHYAPAKSKRLGKRVYHDTFGYGTVIREEGDRLEVHFDTLGSKKILAKFLEEA